MCRFLFRWHYIFTHSHKTINNCSSRKNTYTYLHISYFVVRKAKLSCVLVFFFCRSCFGVLICFMGGFKCNKNIWNYFWNICKIWDLLNLCSFWKKWQAKIPSKIKKPIFTDFNIKRYQLTSFWSGVFSLAEVGSAVSREPLNLMK